MQKGDAPMPTERQPHQPPAPTLEEFFSAIFPPEAEGFLELRALPGPIQEFVRPYDVDAIRGFRRRYRDRNVLFGPATRKRPGDGTLANCLDLWVVFADLDFKLLDEMEVLDRLQAFPLRPAIIIQSGHGLHVYWSVRGVFVQDDLERIENILRRLAQHLGADRSAAEPAHMLRVPGSFNHSTIPPAVSRSSCARRDRSTT